MLLLFQCRLPGNRQNDAHFSEEEGQRRTSVGEERQADAGRRNGVGDDGNIEDRLNADLCNEADRYHGTEAVPAFDGNAEATPDKKRKEQDNKQRSDKAELFTRDRKNEIVLRLGQEQIFLQGISESAAHKSPGADGIEGL